MAAQRNPNQMSFFEHLDELRGRIGKSMILWLAVMVVCFIYVNPIFDLLAEPMLKLAARAGGGTGQEYVWAAVDIKEPFLAKLKTAFWASLVLSSGIFFYHFWGFVAPGLTKSEKRFAAPFLFFMAVFFMLGCWFSFKLAFPYALDYLIGWNEGSLNAYTRSSYLSILFAFVIGMGASFELPLVVYFLSKIGLVTPRFLISKFKYAVLLIFIIAAIITPTPDIYMQTFLAVPMLGLYLLGIGASYFVKRKKDKRAAKEAKAAAEAEAAAEKEDA